MAMTGKGSIQDGSKASTARQRRKGARVFREQADEQRLWNALDYRIGAAHKSHSQAERQQHIEQALLYLNALNANSAQSTADLLDSDSQAAEPDYTPNTMNTENEKAPKRIWVNNPAEVTEHDQRWWYGNEMAFPTVEYVRADLLATARKEAFKEARHRVYMISGSTNVDPSVRKGFAAGVQAAIEVIAALERVATTTDIDKTEKG